MNNVLVIWGETVRSFFMLPAMLWVSLCALHIQRLITVLYSTFLGVIFIGLLFIMPQATTIPPIGMHAIHFLSMALLVLAIRPSVELKSNASLCTTFSGHAVGIICLSFIYACIALWIPMISPFVMIFFYASSFFYYDMPPSVLTWCIVQKRALRWSLYKAPILFFIVLAMYACSYFLSDATLYTRIAHFILDICFSAVICVVYVRSIQEHYEIYYA